MFLVINSLAVFNDVSFSSFQITVGLAVVLIDIPFDIMGIKLLWWTWHDTDPNLFDRMYWVPWNSYYFHATFAFSFCFIFHNSRALLSDREKFQYDG